MDPLTIYIFDPQTYAIYNTPERRLLFPDIARPTIFNSKLKTNRYINLIITINSISSTELTFTIKTNATEKTTTLTLFKPITITDYPIFTMFEGHYRARAVDVP